MHALLQAIPIRILMQSIKDAAHDFEACLKGSRCSSVHSNNLCKQTGCKYFEHKGQMSLYFKREGQDVPILLTWLQSMIKGYQEQKGSILT